MVAIKKISKPFHHAIEAKRILREIKLLKSFRHENIISIKNLLNILPEKNFQELYIITELMDTDLMQIIESQQQLTDEHIQFVMY